MPRGAPEGNQNATKDKRLWANTIRRVVMQEDANKLRQLAEKLVDNALAGDNVALKEIGDRLDGKAMQAIEGTVSIEKIELVNFGDNTPSS